MLNRIYDIVAKHFYLEEESLKKFKKFLFNREIDETYAKIIGPDLRYKVEINNNLVSSNDEGWKMFATFFPSFVKELNLTFENYRKNKVTFNKEERRLFKLVKDFYLQDREIYLRDFSGSGCTCCDCRGSNIDERLRQISAHKLPSEGIYLVLSLNFADWFLCSAAESWSSCMNLDSEHEAAYWTGLPGLIADKNRALVYFTNGNKKKWQDIEVESMLSRSWILLDNANQMRYTKFYPKKLMDIYKLKNIINLDIAPINVEFEAKHPIDLLFHKHGDSSYIYQDKTHFRKIDNTGAAFLAWQCYGGMKVYNKNKQEIFDDTSFYFTDGLSSLIENEENLGLYVKEKILCYNCEERISADDTCLGTDNKYYCEHCFYDLFEICTHCQGTFDKDGMFFPVDDGPYCQRCFEEFYVKCDNCEREVYTNEAREATSGFYCEDCFFDLFELCQNCEEDFERDSLISAPNDEFYCKDCYDELVKDCTDCNEKYMKNEFHECSSEKVAVGA